MRYIAEQLPLPGHKLPSELPPKFFVAEFPLEKQLIHTKFPEMFAIKGTDLVGREITIGALVILSNKIRVILSRPGLAVCGEVTGK